MATTLPDRHGGSAWWLLALGGALLVGGLVLGAWLRGGFGEMLRLLLLGPALLSLGVYVFLWWRSRRPGAAALGTLSPWTRRFLWLMAGAAITFPVAVVLHNVVSGLLGIEEPVFFVLAVVVAPLAFFIGAVGAAVAAVVAATRPPASGSAPG
jgi:hypothetical protein